MARMARLHRVAGFLFAVVFALTGVFMRVTFPAAYGGDAGVRMMYRASHLYILLAALMNLLVGLYLPAEAAAGRGRLRAVGSFFLIAAPGLFTLAFFLEPAPDKFARRFTFAALLLAVLGTGLHLLAAWRRAEK